MSKAFTRESDTEDVVTEIVPRSPLPPGARNYLTVDGAARLRDELDHLLRAEKTPLNENEPKQQQLRIRQLEESLNTAVIVPPPSGPETQVRFGATVTVRSRHGQESRYRIVGVDETDIDAGAVSWLSPIAKALLRKHTGDRVRFRFPSGEEELVIVSVVYENP